MKFFNGSSVSSGLLIFPTATLNPVNGISCAGATVVPLNTPERPTDGPNIHPLWLLTPITIVVLK